MSSTETTIGGGINLGSDAARQDSRHVYAAVGLHIACFAGHAAAVFLSSGLPLAVVLTGLLLALTTVTCISDLRTLRIPNWITYSTLCWAVSSHALGSGFVANTDVATTWVLPVIGLSASLTGAGVCFLAMLVVYSLAGRGAGDVKLATALGALLGPDAGISILLWTHLIAGVVVLIGLGWQMQLWPMITMLFRAIVNCLVPRMARPLTRAQVSMLAKPVPMACFFALGTAATLFVKVLP